LCTRVPLSWYIGACAIGIVVALLLGRRLHGDGALRAFGRWSIGAVVVAGMIGAAWMMVRKPAEGGVGIFPPSWNAKCAWRYCGRVLGPTFDRSPFPVGTPSCQALHMCVNEYPYSDDEYRQLLNLIRARGCAPP
jgi:hypothetical protein